MARGWPWGAGGHGWALGRVWRVILIQAGCTLILRKTEAMKSTTEGDQKKKAGSGIKERTKDPLAPVWAPGCSNPRGAGGLLVTPLSSRVECDTESSLIFHSRPEWLPECVWAAGRSNQTCLVGVRGLWCVGGEADNRITSKKPCLKTCYGSFKPCGFGSQLTATCIALVKWSLMKQKCIFYYLIQRPGRMEIQSLLCDKMLFSKLTTMSEFQC